MTIQTEDLVTIKELPQAKDFIIYPWLYPGRFTLMVGPTNIGKTTLTLEMIAACLKGEQLFNRFPVKKIERVLYLHGEHTIETVREMAQVRGDIPEDHVSVIHDFGDEGSALIRDEAPTPVCREIFRIAKALEPQLIVVEPISAFITDSENNNLMARKLVSFLCDIAASINAALLSHQHVPKSFHDPERPKDTSIPTGLARGALAFEDAAERVIYLTRESVKTVRDSENQRIKIETPKTKGFPVSPVSIELKLETLTYEYVTHAAAERDLIGVYNRRKIRPDESLSDFYEFYKTLHSRGSDFVNIMLKRAKKLGLLDEDGNALL